MLRTRSNVPDLLPDAFGITLVTLEKLLVSAVVRALGGSHVALESLKGVGAAADEGLGEGAVGIHALVVAGESTDDLGFQTAAPGDAPASLRHFFHEEFLMHVGGAKVLAVLGEEPIEFVLAFLREHAEPAGQSVADGVAG